MLNDPRYRNRFCNIKDLKESSASSNSSASSSNSSRSSSSSFSSMSSSSRSSIGDPSSMSSSSSSISCPPPTPNWANMTNDIVLNEVLSYSSIPNTEDYILDIPYLANTQLSNTIYSISPIPEGIKFTKLSNNKLKLSGTANFLGSVAFRVTITELYCQSNFQSPYNFILTSGQDILTAYRFFTRPTEINYNGETQGAKNYKCLNTTPKYEFSQPDFKHNVFYPIVKYNDSDGLTSGYYTVKIKGCGGIYSENSLPPHSEKLINSLNNFKTQYKIVSLNKSGTSIVEEMSPNYNYKLDEYTIVLKIPPIHDIIELKVSYRIISGASDVISVLFYNISHTYSSTSPLPANDFDIELY